MDKNDKIPSDDKLKLIRQIAKELSSARDPDVSAAELKDLIAQLVDTERSVAKKEEERRRRQEQAARLRAEEEERLRQEQHIREVTSMDLPLDWESSFITDGRTQNIHADSIPDALILSLTNLGRVDIEYISSITGEDMKTVIRALHGSIYQNPETWDECFYKGWETAEEYLSGNLMRKWRQASEANEKYKGYFKDNLRAIGKVLPPTVAARDIYVTLGSPWVPADVIDDFITCILKLKGHPYRGTRHDELTGSWEIPNKGAYYISNNIASTSTYGTSRIEALYILERTLNMKTVAVTDEVTCLTNKSGKKRVINKAETLLAIEKQQKMINTFRNWVWSDEKRRQRLETIFENNFGCVRRRIFDGSFLDFPTMSRAVSLYPYQKNAVARILFSNNTLLAHDVGSGKTYVMIAAGMELRLMGLSKKNMYVVPNNLLGQWEQIFKTLYPDARLLSVTPKSFTPSRREGTLRLIRDGDYDGIIIAYSCFDRIPLSKDYYKTQLKEERDRIGQAIKDKARNTAGLRRRAATLDKQILELELSPDADAGICFDELMVTRLFVDEAHNYKNVPIETKINYVAGAGSGGSEKCREMMDKVHFIQRQNNGGGVIFATGTPITNSITDAFVMQRYLQGGELAMLDLGSFDSWIGMFAERVSEFEIDVDTSSYRLATRFARFHNLPELTSLLSSIADFHSVDKSDGIPDFDGHTDSLIARSDELRKYLEDISDRAERVRDGRVRREDDNMLKITTDGRKAALDIRLVDPNATFSYQSKVARCAERVYDIYMKTAAERSTQLIFCDSSTPKSGFNIYDEMKRLLGSMGIPPSDIAFVHDANTERERNALFSKVRSGDIRILIGSTFKLGLGVNVQDRLVALHHLDIPWRPADLTQRNGRILRQGNGNKRVYIYRYITEGSFDAYSWQLLETKEKFICALLSGSMSERSGSDIENTVLDYAEVKALAIGNPLIKRRVEVANELSRCMALQRKAVENHIALERELTELPARIEHQAGLIEKCKEDLDHYTKNRTELDKKERRALREMIYSGVKGNILMPTETTVTTYQGFDILLPVNMTIEQPYLWLVRAGKYYLELGDTEGGLLIRIDNFLERLPDYLEKLRVGLKELLVRQDSLGHELTKKEDYTDKINALRDELLKLDKKLGVKK